jgi:hypothetical protein
MASEPAAVEGMTRDQVIARLMELRLTRESAEAAADLLGRTLRCFEGQEDGAKRA